MKQKMAIIALLRGGIGHYIAELSPYLVRDFDIEYISFTHGLPGDEVKLDDPAITKNIKNANFIISYNNYQEINRSIVKVVKFLKDKKIQILNIHIGTITRETSYVLIPIVTIAKKNGIKIIYTFHDVEPFEEFDGGEELLELFYSLADFATVGNKNEMEVLTKKYKFNRNNLTIAPHGLYSIFDFNKYDQQSAKKYLGISQNKKVILHFGILRPYKGYEDLIQAMPQILKKYPNTFLYISAGVRVFGGPEDIQKLIIKLDLVNDSKLIFDFVPSDEIEPIFKAADIVVLPYKKVSQSGILNLALFFKKPVILSSLFYESPEIDNKKGLVIPPGNPTAIAQAIGKLLGDNQLYQEFVNNIQNDISDDAWLENVETFKRWAKK